MNDNTIMNLQKTVFAEFNLVKPWWWTSKMTKMSY